MHQGCNPAAGAAQEARLILKSLGNGKEKKKRKNNGRLCACHFSLCPPTPHSLLLHLFTAPSPVVTIKKDRTSRNSISLSWQEPEHPNGIILDYEVKYYEKVGEKVLRGWIG